MSRKSARTAEVLRQGGHRGLGDICPAAHQEGKASPAQGSPGEGQGSGGAAGLAGYRLWPRVRVLLLRLLVRLQEKSMPACRAGGSQIHRLAKRADLGLGARISGTPSGGGVSVPAGKSKEIPFVRK